jgi:hypothetical protein
MNGANGQLKPNRWEERRDARTPGSHLSQMIKKRKKRRKEEEAAAIVEEHSK